MEAVAIGALRTSSATRSASCSNLSFGRPISSCVWIAGAGPVAGAGPGVNALPTGRARLPDGERSARELGGPVRIAQMSDTAANAGISALVVFAAFLSINLGLINLLPIPLLDGGHLLFYAYEVVVRRPPHPWMLEFGLKIGLVLVLGLMLFATFNDLVRLPVVQKLVALVT